MVVNNKIFGEIYKLRFRILGFVNLGVGNWEWSEFMGILREIFIVVLFWRLLFFLRVSLEIYFFGILLNYIVSVDLL